MLFPWSGLTRIASVLALTALAGCSGLGHIDVTSDGSASIAQGTLIDKLLGSVAFAGFDKIDFSEEFKNQGVTKGQVDSVHLKSMTLTVTAPADGTLDFLQSLSFFAESDGLAKIEIAKIDSVPKGAKTLELMVEGAEFAPYVVAPSMSISGEVTGQRPDVDTTVKAHVVLDVGVHVL